jgi:hypothetical protein
MLHTTASTANSSKCEEYAATKIKLQLILDEYLAIPKTPTNAERLFLLYQRLKHSTKEAQAYYPGSLNRSSEKFDAISNCLWDEKLRKIGLGIGHFSDRIEFSDKLMIEAHRLNPYTQYRSQTLFSEVIENAQVDSYSFPNVDKARSYLVEFPTGSYVSNVLEILAGFYHDLYAALREKEELPEEERGEISVCFDEYLSTHSEEANRERARIMGIAYFEKLIAVTPPKDLKLPMFLDEMNALKDKRPDNIVNVCGD